MYIEAVPNRNSPPAVLLRESYREAGKVKKRTLANLSKWPPALVDGLKTLLKAGTAVAHLAQTFDIVRSLPHGHVAAVLALMRSVRFERLLDPTPSPERDRALALIAARLLDPASKLATARGLDPETARDSLAESLALGELDENALYRAMDWLLERQDRIERRLAKRHLEQAPRCSTTSPRCGTKASTALWPNAGTRATANAARHTSSSVCCARARAARSPSKCSRAIPPTPPPSGGKSTRCAGASGSTGWCGSATAAGSPKHASANSSSPRA